MSKFNFKIAEELAVDEVLGFAENFVIAPITAAQVLDRYPQVVLAVQMGLLVFNGKIATLTLLDPLLNTDGGVYLSEVTCIKPRVTYLDRKDLSKGLDPDKDVMEIAMKIVSFVIGKVLAEVNKLGKFDYTTLEQLATLFV